MKFCNDCGELWGFCKCEECAACCGELASGCCFDCESPFCDSCLHECAACHFDFCADHIVTTPLPGAIFQAQYHCPSCHALALAQQQRQSAAA